jgi:signal transduction histidine kinase
MDGVDGDRRMPGGSDGPRPAPSERHAWLRWMLGWHLAFWGMVALAALWVGATTELTAGGRAVGFGLLAVLAGAYWLLVMRPGAVRTSARGPGYLVIALGVVGAGVWLDPTMSMLLFIVFSHVWMFTGTLRQGVLFAFALTLVAGIGFLGHYGWSLRVLRDLAPGLGVSLAFSLLMGLWISRIIDQSRDRAALIVELEAARDELVAAEHARGALAERERMAREIHDTLAQGFTSVVMLAQAAAARLPKDPDGAAQRLATIEDVARANLAEARALVAALAPVDLDGTTVADAVRRVATRFGQETRLVVEVDVPDAVRHLGRDQEVVVLRAVQEALANVRRHAGARRVVVRLVPDGGCVRLEVSDDGVGFDAAATPGYGLAGMRGRVDEVGGELAVASTPGAGTRVVVRLPMRPATVQGATA